MRKKRVWRYYCEFCKKSNCSAGAMKKHERHCTMNPDRACRVCENVLKADQPKTVHLCALMPDPEKYTNIDMLKAQIERAIGDIRKMTENDYHDGCPACILAAIRQTQPDWWWLDFDYKEEMKTAFAGVNKAEEQADLQSLLY